MFISLRCGSIIYTRPKRTMNIQSANGSMTYLRNLIPYNFDDDPEYEEGL